MLDFEGALKKPFTDVKKLVIGCVLNTIPIINLFVTGYLVKVAGKTMVGKPGLPEWGKWGRLFRNGIFATLIAIIYGIPLIAVTVAFFGASYLNYLRNNEALHLGLLGGWSFLVIGVGIIVAYFVPGAILNYSRTETWGDAFRIKEIVLGIWRKEYLVAWLFAAVYAIVIGMVFGFLPNVVGVIVSQLNISSSVQANLVILASNLGSAVSSYIVGVTALTVLGEVWGKKRKQPH